MRALKFLCFLMLTSIPFLSMADHTAGGYFEYTCLGNNEYQIDYYFLRDCSGQIAQNPHLYLSSGCGHACEDLGEMNQMGNSEVVDYGCGNTCLFPDGKPGFRLIHFRKNVTLGTVCESWRLNVKINSRNAVDYIDQSGPYYNYCIINNSVVNNSPSIDGPPIVLGCAQWDTKPLYSVSASNGDQLVYDLVPSLVGEPQGMECSYHDVGYVSGLTAQQSFPSTAPFNLNPSTGTFDFRPTLTGRSYFAVRIREYRNGILIGTSVADGMIYVTNCIGAGDATFNSFQASGNSTFSVSAEPGIYCTTATVESNETIEEITVDAPSFVNWSVNYISDEEAEVTICVNTTGLGYTCDEQTWGLTINAKSSGESDDCLANVNGFPDKGHYSIYKHSGEYCPENLFFTNRNSQSGVPMPLYAHAEERIWIGDNMPSIAPPMPEGYVVINGNAEYIAGTEIILPSCNQGTGCVTLMGNITMKIAPNTCSADCSQEIFAVNVREYFKCSEERLEVEAEGTGPFTYQLIILGDTIIQDIAAFYIHDIISEQDNGQVPYTMTVYDAAGDYGTFEGNILGTKRFYEPVLDNKIYFWYPDTINYFNSGYYYAGNMGVYSTLPAYWTDSINTSPPWYGATHMRLEIWDRWGNSINYMDHDLELQPDGSGGEDWSLNQGEFYWTGKVNNGIWADCYEGSDNFFFNYVLKARNCYNHYNINSFAINIDEASVVALFACTNDDPWHPVEDKSTGTGDDNNDYAEYQKFTGTSRIPEFVVDQSTIGTFTLVPNPANDWIELTGSFKTVNDLIIVDATGKTVLEKSVLSRDEIIDVSSLASGVYTVHCKTTEGMLNCKLIII